jgi:hypothetical protein
MDNMNYDMDSITASSPAYNNTATISIYASPEDRINEALDTYSLNHVTVTHKVAEHELIKLKETTPDYADHIKQNLTQKATEEVGKKLTFTKKFDKDLDVHHFNGRVWVFTDEELKNLLKEVNNVL